METIYTFYHFKMKGVENVLLTSSTNIQWQFNSEATNKVGIKCLVTDRPKNHMLCFFNKKNKIICCDMGLPTLQFAFWSIFYGQSCFAL